MRTTRLGYKPLSLDSFPSLSLPGGGVRAPGAPAPCVAAARFKLPYGVEVPLGLVPRLEIELCRPSRSASIPPERGDPGDIPNEGEGDLAAGPQGIVSVPLTIGEGGADESIPPPARERVEPLGAGREAVRPEGAKLGLRVWLAASAST